MTPQRSDMRKYVLGVIGDNVVAARKASGLTQKSMGELLVRKGTCESYWRSIEAGQKELSLIRLIEIASALNVEPSELLRGL